MVGAGNVALRKIKRLLSYQAIVTVVSPEIIPQLKSFAKKRRIVFKNKVVSLRDLQGAYLVISAASDRKINSFVSSYCKKKGILVNVVDSPKECNFILPSVINRGDLTITISTNGISPALSKKIRQDLEKKFGIEYGKFLRIMKKLRPKVINKIKDPKARKTFFKKAVRAIHESNKITRKSFKGTERRFLTR